MPMVRTDAYHWQASGQLRSKRIHPREKTDTQDFRYPPAPMYPDIVHDLSADGPTLGEVDGQLLAFGWKPLVGMLGSLGMYGLIASAVAFWFYSRGVEGYWGTLAAILFPFGVLTFGWYIFVAHCRHFVVFDRRRGLVHISGWFRWWRPDAVRWDDLGVVIAKIPGGYLNSTPMMEVCAVRPPCSLRRREYPFFTRRAPIVRSDMQEHNAEQSWRRIVTFMTEPLSASPWSASRSSGIEALADLEYDGDWRKARWHVAGRIFFRPFYGLELLTEPNWVCDEQGRWHRVPEGRRERIALPEGPDENRVPLDPNEPLWRRVRRRLMGEGPGSAPARRQAPRRSDSA